MRTQECSVGGARYEPLSRERRPAYLAYNLGNFLRTLVLPKEVDHWPLTTIREKLVKIGAQVVAHGRYIFFQMDEVAVSGGMFGQNLVRIARLSAPPALA